MPRCRSIRRRRSCSWPAPAPTTSGCRAAAGRSTARAARARSRRGRPSSTASRAIVSPETRVELDPSGNFAGVTDEPGNRPSPTWRSSCSPSSRTRRVPATAPTSRLPPERSRTAGARPPARRAARRRPAVGPSARRHRPARRAGTPSSPPGCPVPRATAWPTCCSAQAPFTGRLPYTWPRSNEQLPIDPTAPPEPGCDGPLFPRGFGLTTDETPPPPFCPEG